MYTSPRMRFLPAGVLTCLLLSACMDSTEVTYEYGFDADTGQRGVFNNSFAEWERTVGIEFQETQQSGTAHIVFLVGELPEDLIGFANWETSFSFSLNHMAFVETLIAARITFRPDLWQLEPVVQQYVIMHELGHVFTNSSHTRGCPSTMHSEPTVCGTTFVDELSAMKAARNIEKEWLSSRDSAFLITR